MTVASHAALAQESRVHWDLMGGYNDTLGGTANFLQGGWLLGAAVSFSPSAGSPLDVRFDFSYSQHNATISYINNAQQALGQQVDYGYGSLFAASANLLYHFNITGG
ncbi:MAG TPA: hypothetical protein VKQ31_12705, partial [Steroidobacteraceae bacterium]|nr:hypothetical protein [Steroidobacteraceae bacterium]